MAVEAAKKLKQNMNCRHVHIKMQRYRCLVMRRGDISRPSVKQQNACWTEHKHERTLPSYGRKQAVQVENPRVSTALGIDI